MEYADLADLEAVLSRHPQIVRIRSYVHCPITITFAGTVVVSCPGTRRQLAFATAPASRTFPAAITRGCAVVMCQRRQPPAIRQHSHKTEQNYQQKMAL
jgi:hypothetical protein